MIGTIDIELQAARPDFPLPAITAFVGSPSNLRIRNVPRKVGKWDITKVYVTANLPDNRSASVECVIVGGVYVATISASTAVGISTNGYSVTADGVDERGNSVAGYVLGKGDVVIVKKDGTITVGDTTYYVHLLDSAPTTPHKGDLCKIDGVYKLYDGSAWVAFGGGGGTPSDYETVKANAATGATHAAESGNPHNTAIGDIDQLGQRLDSADGNIQTAQSAADAAQTTANDAVSKAEDAQSRVGSIEGVVYQSGEAQGGWWFVGEAYRAEVAFSADALSEGGKSALFNDPDFNNAVDARVTSGIKSIDASYIKSGTVGSARLPVATSTAKGAVMPIAKTTDMTQSVGVDSSGRLYTKPASGGVTKIVAGSNVTISPDSGTGEVTISASGGGGLTGHKLTVNILTGCGAASTANLFVAFADGHVESGNVYSSTLNPWGLDCEPSQKTFTGVVAVGYGTMNNTLYRRGETVASVALNTQAISSDTTISVQAGCLVRGTLISLADGNLKPIEDITYEDELLVWDFDNACKATAKPAWIKICERIDYAFENIYSNGAKLITTGRSETGWGHRHFDTDRSEFRYTPTTVGDSIATIGGKSEHIGCRKLKGDFEYYNLITERHYNCYANGILTSCSMNNLYKIDGMKFVKDKVRQSCSIDGVDEFLCAKLRVSELPWSNEQVVKYLNNLKRKMRNG